MKAALFLLPGLLLAQTDWTVPPEFRAAGYTREKTGKGIALSGPGPNGAMTQTFDAGPYRGAPVRLRASVRVEGGGTAQLLLRVDRESDQLGFFDNMSDRPVHAGDWTVCEVLGEVASDARTIEVGVLSAGSSTVWVDHVSFEKLPPASPENTAVRTVIERNYDRVDTGFAGGDVDAVARLATPDARVVIGGSPTPLAAILVQIRNDVRKGTKYESRSTITAFRLDGNEATVWVNNRSATGVSGVLSSNRDLWVKLEGAWKLRESTLIATQPLAPPEVLADIPRRAGMPGLQGVRIILFEGDRLPEVPGFTPLSLIADRRTAEQRVIAYLKEHDPEAQGHAALAFEGNDPTRLAAVVRSFDNHRASTPEWIWARQAAVFVHQSILLADRPEELTAAQAIWLASTNPETRMIVRVANAAKVAPIVRARYGKQVYVVGGLRHELLGGDYFVDLAAVPPESPLGRWVAAQKLPFDGIVGQ